jgi:Zn-finger nucleic acid-binding protein
MAIDTMRCPRCQGTELEERERDGVVVDVCRSCRGLWLDRGELEKLILRATRELDEYGSRRDDTPPRGVSHRQYDDEHHHYRRDPRRKKSFFESLGDVFD